jgi:RNA polymerase primary sigma factor
VDTFGKYLENIARWPLLTPAQEIELGRLKQAGIETSDRIGTRKPTRQESRTIKTGQRAVERMVLCNLRLVVSIAKKYIGHCDLLDIEDLVQCGSIGLKHAAVKFDHEKGYKFSTYATWWIRQEIQRGIYKTDRIIRLPEHCRLVWARLRKHASLLTHELGRAPTQKELMQAADIGENDFMLITRAMDRISSLNEQLENGGEPIDYLADINSNIEIAPDYSALLNALQTLKEDEFELITKYFGIGGEPQQSMAELSRQRGVSRQSIKQKMDKIKGCIRLRLHPQSA